MSKEEKSGLVKKALKSSRVKNIVVTTLLILPVVIAPFLCKDYVQSYQSLIEGVRGLY